jgi:hypothetical protein
VAAIVLDAETSDDVLAAPDVVLTFDVVLTAGELLAGTLLEILVAKDVDLVKEFVQEGVQELVKEFV